FEPREVRRILVGQYEMRYEIQGDTIYVLRLWHTREDRSQEARPCWSTG
ncbi:type II toxin-antitoxin system RelE/ParE family toxin, partial [Mycobacterium tuberculosis]|nr:type II toxin-antitoxin system RelE/ParE family toxin [Mycobacterium tuberculosis]